MRETNFCIHCGLTKPAIDFYMQKQRNKLRSICRECNKKAKRRRATAENTRKWHLSTIYGITVEQYTEMYENQAQECKICHAWQPLLRIDHNHKTGKIRGLLCNECNIGLGVFEEDIDILKSAIKYLEES